MLGQSCKSRINHYYHRYEAPQKGVRRMLFLVIITHFWLPFINDCISISISLKFSMWFVAYRSCHINMCWKKRSTQQGDFWWSMSVVSRKLFSGSKKVKKPPEGNSKTEGGESKSPVTQDLGTRHNRSSTVTSSVSDRF